MFRRARFLNILWRPLITTVRNHSFPNDYMYYLRNLPQTNVSYLSNCLTVASEERDSYHACLGIYVDAGSRYEYSLENGIAHFFEHVAFRSTTSRNATTLQQCFNNLGAQFHAFTSREMCGYYVECLVKDAPIAMEMLVDCIFNNAFSHDDIQIQKQIVYNEMIEHDTAAQELLMDYLHLTAFQGTQLGQSVMGKSSNLHNFSQDTLKLYHDRFFTPLRTVLVAVGGLSHEELECLAKAYMGHLVNRSCLVCDECRYTGSEIRFRNDKLPVANVAIAVEGPSFCDYDYYVMEVASSLIGGWDRSQAGGSNNASNIGRAAAANYQCDAYQNFQITYKDTGLWGITFMAPSLNLEDILYNIQHQWMALCTTVTEGEVDRAKRELITRILSQQQSAAATSRDIGRWLLYNKSRPSVDQKVETVHGIKADDVKSICTKYLYDKCPAVSAVGAVEGLPEYTRIRANMYWLRV